VTNDGDIYVADFWNQRIQVFDPQMQYRTEISVESWPKQNSTAITDRAYLTVLDDGRVLATDPSNGRIVAFDNTGTQISAWKLPSDTGVTRPVGIALAGDQAYISDGFANRVVRVPVSALLVPSGTPQ
jgi:sugar lactone lactonase YvrE